jgi:hypothetical protein
MAYSESFWSKEVASDYTGESLTPFVSRAFWPEAAAPASRLPFALRTSRLFLASFAVGGL